MNVSRERHDGAWVPAIPLPVRMLFVRECPTCRRWFATKDGFRGHWSLKHSIAGEDA